MRLRQLLPTFLAVAALASAASAQSAKSLDWPAFAVDATLDSTGTLLVRERQTLLFTGDWNGGERQFTVRDGQRFEFRRIVRIDSLTGAEIPMQEGALEQVDGYRMMDGHTLRWRSRLPSDPPFLNTKITYLIEYAYSDILLTQGDGYRFDHEFAFRDRVGTIANFALTLHVDPKWKTPAGFTGNFRQDVLEPGIGYVVNIPLEWRGAGQPSAVRRSPPSSQRMLVAAAVLIVLVGMTVSFLRDESMLGRFAPLTPRSVMTREWLEANVLSMKPEVVGYAWDERVGPAEVSAVLARLVAEKKLASRVEQVGWKMFTRPVLHLNMLVPRDTFVSYERTLIDAFFLPMTSTTSTDAVRIRYRSTGFDPASILRAPLEGKYKKTFGDDLKATMRPRKWPLTVGLLMFGVAALVIALIVRSGDALATILSVVAGGVPVAVFTLVQALLWRKRVVRPALHLVRVLLPVALLAGVLGWAIVTGAGQLGIGTLAALALLLIAVHHGLLHAARWPQGAAQLTRRKRFASVREFCQYELRQPKPALDDTWYPYLLALGLGKHVEQWFRAFGGEQAAYRASRSGGISHTYASSSNDSGDVSTGGGSFSGFGGGGGFSGGGATVEFGSAVSAFSSAVSAPSSGSGGSSGGGSSSSGGSSGGGGGGGW